MVLRYNVSSLSLGAVLTLNPMPRVGQVGVVLVSKRTRIVQTALGAQTYPYNEYFRGLVMAHHLLELSGCSCYTVAHQSIIGVFA